VARLTVACAFGILVGLVAGAAIGIRADEVEAAAAEAGVDPQDLLGAINTTGQEPRTYLRMVGELPAAAIVRPLGVFDRLAACESNGRWHIATGNGYFGGVQMDMTFWRNYGGLAFAARPDLASREQQIVVAERGLAVQGPGAWPVCSRRVGLH
jgi:hypothetical protein